MNNQINENVLKMAKLKLTGNITPAIWYKKLLLDSGKPNIPAILILSDIIYWYRPIESKSSNGDIKYKQKFKTEKLQRQYQYYISYFGYGKTTFRNAINYLEQKKLITKELKNIIGNGRAFNNVLFLDIVPENINKLTFE